MNNTDQRLREIAERENKATKGPWRFTKVGDVTKSAPWFLASGESGKENGVLPGINAFADLPERPNSQFIAHSRQDVPWLLKLIEHYRGALEICAAGECGAGAARDALNFSPENL